MGISTTQQGRVKETAPYVNVSGVWKPAIEAWARQNNEWRSVYLAEGASSTDFQNRTVLGTFGTGFNGTVYDIAIQSNGQILVGGGFTTFNGVTRNRLVRLNADGTEDTAFNNNLGTGFNSAVRSIAIQSNGQILVGGEFTALNGVTRNRLVRLNSNGTLDTTFSTNLGVGFNSVVYDIAIQSDGQILVGGNFTALNSVTRNRLVRLNSNGTVDTAFYTNLGTGFNSVVWSVVVQSNGQILVGGAFTALNGVTRNRLVRLNSNGTLDTTFSTNLGTGFNNAVNQIAIQSDGQILVGGEFTSFNGVTRNQLVRLNSNGNLDTTFSTNLGTGFNGGVWSVVVQSNGQILVGGAFTALNGVTRNRLVRLNSNGTLDTTFSTNLGTGFSSVVWSVVVQSDDKILVGGNFVELNISRTSSYLVRLQSTGVADNPTVFKGANNSIFSIAIQSNGQILVGGQFTAFNGVTRNYLVRLNADGTEDTAFNNTLGTGFNNTVNQIVIQSNGQILVGGLFTTFNGVTRNRLVRLNADGTEDTAFNNNLGTGFNSSVRSIAIQSNGQILVGGQFTTFNGVTRPYLVRLNADGTLDTTLSTSWGAGFDSSILSIAIQSNGQILVGGGFTSFNGVTRNRLVRLNADGTEDTTFNNNLGTGFNGAILPIAIQSDGQILVGGQFTAFNGVTRNYLVRLNANGTENSDLVFNLGIGFDNTVNQIAIQSNGQILVGGQFTAFNGVTRNYLVRLNADGTEDTAFNNTLGTGFNNTVNQIVIQSNGQILVGGGFASFKGVWEGGVARIGADVVF